jgi:mycothiol system anti-sigma-R factor
VNCKEALEKIYEFLDKDGNIPLSEIEQHLDWCRPCWDRFEFEKRLIERLKKSCHQETCSDSLKQRIQQILEKY